MKFAVVLALASSVLVSTVAASVPLTKKLAQKAQAVAALRTNVLADKGCAVKNQCCGCQSVAKTCNSGGSNCGGGIK